MIYSLLKVWCSNPLLFYYSPSLPLDLKIFAFNICFGVRCIYVYSCYSVLLNWSLYHYIGTLFVSFYIFDLKSVLFDKVWLLLSAFGFHFLEYLFLSLHFSLSLTVRWISCRYNIVGSSVLVIHSATLYLFTGEFNPFSFKILINKEGLTLVIVLMVFWLFCRFFVSFFLSRSPL